MLDFESIFKNTFVINLEHRVDRRELVKDELKKLPISYSFFDAINGHELDYSGPLLKGEIGIKFTHIKILQKCIEENLDSCFIFEDDVELHDNVYEELLKALVDLPEKVDLLYLGASHHQPPILIKGNIYSISHSYCAHAVFINKNIFQELLNYLLKIEQYPLDVIYAMLQPTLNSYAIYPHLAWQKNTYSDIQNKFIDYEFLKREFVRFEKI